MTTEEKVVQATTERIIEPTYTPPTPGASVVAALAAVSAELPNIGKDSQAAAAQGGYAYRGIEAITRHASPLLAKAGVVFVPSVVSWERDAITVAGKPWTDDRLLICYTIYGPGGDHITAGPFATIGRDNADKGANKCLTQAYKQCLLQVLCIADGKDDSDRGSVEADSVEAPEVEAVRSEIERLRAAHDQLDISDRATFERWKNAATENGELPERWHLTEEGRDLVRLALATITGVDPVTGERYENEGLGGPIPAEEGEVASAEPAPAPSAEPGAQPPSPPPGSAPSEDDGYAFDAAVEAIREAQSWPAGEGTAVKRGLTAMLNRGGIDPATLDGLKDDHLAHRCWLLVEKWRRSEEAS